MKNTFVFFSNPIQDSLVQADITALLGPGETITDIVPAVVTPVTSPAFTVALQSAATNPIMQFLLHGGVEGVSYGNQVIVTTTARVLVVMLAVTAQTSASFTPYTTQNPEAFADLIDEVEAGRGAMGTAMYLFPPGVDPSGGYVTWELLSADGTVYAGGNAFDYTVRNNGVSVVALARCVIVVPSTVPPTLDGQRYQLRYTLELATDNGIQADPNSNGLQQSSFFLYENIRVTGLNTVPLGVEPSIELSGNPAMLQLVTDRIYDNVTFELSVDNQTVIAATPMPAPDRVANGYLYAGVIPTDALPVTLLPYNVVWKYWNSNNPGYVVQERADLYIVNSSIQSAIYDVKAKINKSRTTLYGSPDLLFPEATIMTWLRRGGDSFNGAFGQFTNFTFTNAKGIVREFWLVYAELGAIQAQYLAEGEKAFDFQGAAIQLNVDRTQYLDNMEGKLQARIDNELKAVKSNLIIKGNTSGDGSADASRLMPGAIGAVGITITPASMWGRFLPSYMGGLK